MLFIPIPPSSLEGVIVKNRCGLAQSAARTYFSFLRMPSTDCQGSEQGNVVSSAVRAGAY